MRNAIHANNHGWRFEWQVNLALVVTVMLQAAMALWWAGGAAERIAQLEEETDRLADISVRLAGLEAHVSEVHASVDRIEKRLDK